MAPRETRLLRRIDAPPHVVYQLLLDAAAVPAWKTPDGMTCRVHVFEPHEGGQFRVSLTYRENGAGKSSEHTDTYHGKFVQLTPGREVVERMQFETADPSLQGWMTVTYRLEISADGTELLAVHSGVPEGVSLEDNELGWSMALDKLALLAKARAGRSGQGLPLRTTRHWLPSHVYATPDDASAAVGFLISCYSTPGHPRLGPYVLAIEDGDTGRLLGHVGFSPLDDDVEVSYAIAESVRGNRYGAEALVHACRWVADACGVSCVIAITAAANGASRRTLERARFAHEGDERRLFQGIMQDVSRYRWKPDTRPGPMALPAIARIVTSRLLVRPVAAEDLADLLDVNGDEEVTRFLPYPRWTSIADGAAWFERMRILAEGGTAQQLVIERKDDRKVIGAVLLFRYEASSSRLELGYVLGRAHWRQGLAVEALRAVCEHLFVHAKLRRIEAEVNPDNAASCRLVERLGFTLEGRLRKRWVAKGRAYDVNVYGCLADEWPASPSPV